MDIKIGNVIQTTSHRILSKELIRIGVIESLLGHRIISNDITPHLLETPYSLHSEIISDGISNFFVIMLSIAASLSPMLAILRLRGWLLSRKKGQKERDETVLLNYNDRAASS